MLSKTGITAQESNSLPGCDRNPNKAEPWKVIIWFFLFRERGEGSGSLLAGLWLLRVQFPDHEERGS